MEEYEYFNAVRELWFYFLVAPFIILLGMAIAGKILDSLLTTNSSFSTLFVYIGGIPGIGIYYYKKWKEFNKKKFYSKKNQAEELKKKYPLHNKEIDLIHKSYCNLTNYFASLVAKKEFSARDLFCLSVVNRTNQCINTAEYCLLKDLQFSLLNIVRQMIEIYATNEYVLKDIKNFEKAVFGNKDHPNGKLKLPNIKTIIEKLEKKEPTIIKVYNEYSELCHPNSRSVFSVFREGKNNGKFSMSSHSKIIDAKDAYHIIRNTGGIANRIYISTKEINPLKRYFSVAELSKSWKNGN